MIKQIIRVFLFGLICLNNSCLNQPETISPEGKRAVVTADSANQRSKPRAHAKGDFNGDGEPEYIYDSLTTNDPFCYSTVYFSNSKCPAILDTGMFVSHIEVEGNLDGSPGDEITIFRGSCEASEWMAGTVYSFRKNKWIILVDRFSVYGVSSGVDYVKRDSLLKDHLTVAENGWEGDSLVVRNRSVKILQQP